jgi:hypothetical protein
MTPKKDWNGSWFLAIGLAAPAIALCLIILIPFYDKAFTIDDTLFMLQAEHALHDPLHPTAFEVVWSEIPQRLSSIMPSGPVMAYLLLPAAALHGAEWLAHLAQWAMLALGLVATAALALRLGLSASAARWCALLTAASPAVLGMAGTVMPDIPAMALGVLGIERYVAFLPPQRRCFRLWLGGGAALCLGLAALSRPHLILLVIVAGLLALAQDRAGKPPGWRFWPWWSLWPLGLAGSLSALVLRLTQDPLKGTGVVSSIGFFASPLGSPKNLLAFLTHWTLALPLVLPWAVWRWRRLPMRLIRNASIVAALLMVVTAFWGTWGTRYVKTLYLSPFLGVAVACFVDLLRDRFDRRDRIGLALAAWLFLALPVLLYVQLPSKYLVPSAPAAALLLLRELYSPVAGISSGRQRYLRMRLLLCTVGIGALLGLLIVRTDAAFAQLGRRAAAELIQPRVRRGEKVWFVGRWGFQWYAERAGAVAVTRTPPLPLPGDIIVASMRAADACLIDMIPNRRFLQRLSDESWGGRLMADEVGAGFFSNGWGLLPWMVSGHALDRYDVFRVE